MSCRSLPVRWLLGSDSSSLQPPSFRPSNKEFRNDSVARSLAPSSSDCHVPCVNQRDSTFPQSGHPNRSALALSLHRQPPCLSGCHSDHEDAGVSVTPCVPLPSNAK